MSPLRLCTRTRSGGGPRLVRVSLAVAVAVALLAGAPVALAPTMAGAAERSSSAPPPVPPAGPGYRPPVDAPVIDPFRPPERRFGPGNRGVTYALAPLTPVRVAAAGEVVFAGQVAGTLHVTVRHADGLRTSYSFLASTTVVAGTTISAGTVVGLSAEVLHVGARTPDGSYLDPELLWSTRWEARLVPGGDDGTPPLEQDLLREVVRDRTGPLASWLATGGRRWTEVGVDTLDAFGRRLRLWARAAEELDPAVHVRRFLDGIDRWARQRHACTAAEVAAAAPPGRRIVVEVAGIGSTSDGASIDRLDTATLGYDDGDIIRFSYAGGRVPPPGDRSGGADPFVGVTTTEYGGVDSQADLEESGRRLAQLLDEVARAAPGVPIDVIAHSQGGVVSRLALEHAERTGTLPPEVQNLVTLSSPHQGADLATAVEAVRGDPAGAALLDQARRRLGVDLDPSLPAAGQLSEVSPVMVHLADRPVPDGVRFTSIAARGDVVVPVGRTDAPGANRATVTLMGVSAHDQIPASAPATREILLALSGRPPTCRSLTDAVLDLGVGEAIAVVEDVTGAAALGVGAAVPA